VSGRRKKVYKDRGELETLQLGAARLAK